MKDRPSRARDLRENLKVHLPTDYGWKVLANLVSDLSHILTDRETKQILSVIRSRNIEEYLSLSEDWGPQGMSTVGKSIAEMRATYQVASLLKKFRFPSDNAARRSEAVKKFLAAEDTCKSYNHSGYRALALVEDERMCGVFTHARAFLKKLLGHIVPDNDILTHWSRHGPGANLDTKNGNTSLYFKYSEWPYSCTKDALPEARLAIEADERWLGALEDSYRDRYDIPKTAILNRDAFWSAVFNVVPGNRIAFVPKNSQTDRSIAIEPSMNLYLQLGIDGYIRRRLLRWGVDLDDQMKNRELARLGSLNWEDPENFVTLDLAAASDSISLSVCKMLLPKLWYNHLMKLRSPQGDLDSEIISYEKISSMGNGFTFALESAIFTSIVYGVQKEFQGAYDRNKCAIYGDDLIVENTIAPMVVDALELAGFTINSEKSFFEGPFRESCGADWFKGAPVRPVFFTSTPTSVMELWTDINRLRRILSLRFMEEESNTERLMDTWIPAMVADIKGPCSDEQFDSYKHVSTPQGAYKNCLWKYKTVTVRSKPVRGESFLFRKLMHSLRDTVDVKHPYVSPRDVWKGLRKTGGGSRFTVYSSNAVIVSLSHSVASYWQSEYAD